MNHLPNWSSFLKQAGDEDYISRMDGVSGKSPFKVVYSLPEGGTRDLTPEEQAAIDEHINALLPDMLTSKGTPAPKLLASPGKSALLTALATLAGTTGVGAALSSKDGWNKDKAIEGAKKGAMYGSPLALLLGALAYNKRKDSNEEIIDTMRRYPKGQDVTLRDIEAGPAKSRLVVAQR